MIKLAAWNIRGMNDPLKQKELSTFVRVHSLSVVCILVTRVRIHNKVRIFNSILPGWELHHKYEHAELGRIWVCWDPRVVEIVDIFFFFGYLRIYYRKGIPQKPRNSQKKLATKSGQGKNEKRTAPPLKTAGRATTHNKIHLINNNTNYKTQPTNRAKATNTKEAKTSPLNQAKIPHPGTRNRNQITTQNGRRQANMQSSITTCRPQYSKG